jgi:hypothetical protein
MAIGAKVHGRIIKYGLDNDPIIETSLLGLYGELGCITNARKVFDNIPVRDSVSWNWIISSYVDKAGELTLERRCASPWSKRIVHVMIW